MNFAEYIETTSENLKKLKTEEFLSLLEQAGKMLLLAIESGGTILVCGNGGSHADAQHFAGELVNYFTKKHKALSVIALGTNSAVASAWSNDHGFENQFAREVEAYGDTNSVLLGITTSGKSLNINRAFEKAKLTGTKTIALTSERAINNLDSNVDLVIPVPADETHKIQECHIVIYHALCIYVEENLSDHFLI
jgi:D-sedoheptulose 7-phosphate isomerase